MWFFKSKTAAEIERVKQEIAQLKEQKRNHQTAIKNLKKKLYSQKETSVYVNAALNDALSLSKEITESAQSQAKQLLHTKEEQLNDKGDEFEAKVKLFKAFEQEIMTKEASLKLEIKDFIQAISDTIDDLDTGSFEQLCQALETRHNQVARELEATKNWISDANTLQEESEEDKVPVYQMMTNFKI